MDLLGLLGLVVVFLAYGYPYVQSWRERALARRLERTRDPREAAAAVDAAIRQYHREGDAFDTLHARGWTSFLD